MVKRFSTVKTDIIFTGFGSYSNHANLKIDDFGENESDLDLNSNGVYQEPTICLDLLKTMIATVLETESDVLLLTAPERTVLRSFQELSVHAQNLFIFLVIHPNWHRLPSLRLVEIPWGDLSSSITELSRSIPATFDCPADIKPKLLDIVKAEERTIDLSASVHPKREELFEELFETKYFLKSEPDDIPVPSDDVKFYPSPENATAGPSTLVSSPASPRPEPIPSLCITESEMTLRQLLEYMGPEEQRIIGKELKLKPGKKKTDLIDSILETSAKQTNLLDFFGKGKAKAGTEKRSSQEERLRAMIMKRLQKVVRINPDVFDILRRVHIIYFRSTQFPTEIFPRPLRHLQRKYPEYARERDCVVWVSRPMMLAYEDALKAEAQMDDVLPSNILPGPLSQTDPKDKKAAATRKARLTVKLFDEVYELWAAHLGIKSDPVPNPIPGTARPTLERLEPGYALTRVLHKGAKAFKVLNKRAEELDVLDGLLAQSHWCRGLRGTWHIRRMTILAEKTEDSGDDEAESAIKASTEGLSDPATGLVYRPALIQGLGKLQKRLQISAEDQVDISESAKVAKCVIQAVRIIDESEQKKKRSLWMAKDNEVVPIETLVSQHYEETGFSRVMTGSCVFTTLFTLLFWDIIFMPIDGAFDTHFQTCPLDLCEDTFFAVRQAVIEHRLSEIKEGKAMLYLEKHDQQHRAAEPCAVGVRWDLCSRKNLIEIVRCIPRRTLVTICQMFCEDYVAGCMGAPDLIAWDLDDKQYKLVHIKGPGYPSRQSQKAWRDVLARGNADQEVYEVVELGKKKKGKKGKNKAAESGSDCESGNDELESEEDDAGFFQTQIPAVKKRPRSPDEDEEYQPKHSKKRKTRS
ncbi:hypothetical protein C8R44DRAFT_766426 [Mycena epipterygia]|nr:hypothetical protein C8R44DRAFT_766426 [Mycena epipterygia]